MRHLQIVLICFLLLGCELSPERSIETVIAIQTSTPSFTPRPNLTATNQAATQTMRSFNFLATSTELAKRRETATAKIGLILEEIQIAANDVDKLDLSKAKLVYGPTNHSLTHLRVDNAVIVNNALLRVKNFVATIKFINPYDTSSTGQWDYGLLFRNEYGNHQYRLTVLSNQSWLLYNAESDEYVYSKNDKNINPKAGDENKIWLIVIDTKAYLFINGAYTKTLDVSARLASGDVSPATGLFYGNLTERKITEYQDFTVWSLP